MPDETLTVRKGVVDSTSMRCHELALQRWFYSKFFVAEGYSVPVIFSSPMDAFAEFGKLWESENNPFAYLSEAKDQFGTPLYQAYPATPKYPLISLFRRGWRFRPTHNASIHNKIVGWPVVDGSRTIGSVKKADLGYVTTAKRPMAWDFRWQADHYCLRPDTQAFFVEALMREMYRTGGTPQTWITVNYPGWGNHTIRLFIEGDIESATPDQPEDGKQVEFRTTFQLVLEGYSVDIDFQRPPALWKIAIGDGNVGLNGDNVISTTSVEDLRTDIQNPNFNERSDLPPS